MSQEFEPDDGAGSGQRHPNVYRDWPFLQRLDRDLCELAIRYRLPLDDIPDGLEGEPLRLARIRRKEQVDAICAEQARRARIAKQERDLFRLSDQQLGQLEDRYKIASDEELRDARYLSWEPAWEARSQAERLAAIQREQHARATEPEGERKERWSRIQSELLTPDSWQELLQRVFHSGSSLERFVRQETRDYGGRRGLRQVHHDDVENEVMGYMYFFILRNAGTWYRRKAASACSEQATDGGIR
jgi:hypothetical protein